MFPHFDRIYEQTDRHTPYNGIGRAYASHRAAKTATRSSASGSGVFRGGAMVRPSPWSDYELLDNFCIVFVSLVARLNNKILGPWLQLTLRVFCRRLAPSLLK